MAEAIIGGVVQSIADHAVSLLAAEIGLACGVKAELHNLRGTVSAIQAVIRDAEKRQVEEEAVRDWLRKLGDVAYEADDLLDDFSIEVLRRDRVTRRGRRILNDLRIFFSFSNRFIYALKMAHQVKSIRSRIDAIDRDRVQFQLDGNAGGYLESSALIPLMRETIPCMPEPHVIGRDKDKKEIMEFLSDHDSEENVTILAIMGIGGLGKTTLARTVFNDKGVEDNFELKLWVCVSTNFIVEDILRKMLKECGVNCELRADLRMNDLAIELGKQLDGKKYLLVLDNVWNDSLDEWLKLKGYLMNGAKGSKILVTTRESRFANIMTDKCHELHGLQEDDALSLLMLLTRKQEHAWKGKDLEVIAKEILRKCVGVPLAITTIAGILLLETKTEKEWATFENHELSSRSLEGDIMSTLKLSYDFMPHYLKPCFSYCCLFPKDHELNPDELIHLWMAEGFIGQKSSSGKKTMEEVGKDYFEQLILRNFFIEVENDVCGNVVRCKMHDLIHDLAQSVVGEECVTIENLGRDSIPEGARHVSFNEFLGPVGSKRDFRVRSLLLYDDCLMRIGVYNLDVSCFKNLRALRLRNAGIEKTISESIGELKNLRSLDLSENYHLKSFPNSVSKLLKLQTLSLCDCFRLEVLPRCITKLVNLRKLDVSGCNRLMHMPRGIGKLTNLQVLLGFVVGKQGSRNAASLSELSSLSRLRKLSIRRLERLTVGELELDASFSMKKFDHLQSLEFVWVYDDSLTLDPGSKEVLEKLEPHQGLKRLKFEGYNGTKIPSWLVQQRKLVEIEISKCKGFKHLPPLDQLPCLKRISIVRMSNLEHIELSSENDESDFFSSLEEVELMGLYQFRGWERKRSNEIEEEDIAVEKDIPSSPSSSSPLLRVHTFSDKIKVSVEGCPRFHWMHGQGQLLELGVTSKEMLHRLCLNATAGCSSPASLAITTGQGRPFEIISTLLSSVSLSKLTSLIITEINNLYNIPIELFPSLSSLRSLDIRFCNQLTDLSGEVILRYLTSLEILSIHSCPKLEFSTEDDDSECVILLQKQGHYKLRAISISHCDKMETLPGWLQYLSKLSLLHVSNCHGLKSLLPARHLLGLLSSLQILKFESCRELDLTIRGEPGDEYQFQGHTKLIQLDLEDIAKLETLPWWVQHLTHLRSLTLVNCENMKALPEWFPSLSSLERFEICYCGELSAKLKERTGEDWHKVSHIPYVSNSLL